MITWKIKQVEAVTRPKNDNIAHNGLSADTILDSFPIKDITNHSGEPTFQVIQDVHNQLKSNTALILANIGGGHFVLLGFII